MKVGRQQQKDDDDRDLQTNRDVAQRLAHRRDLAAHADGGAARRLAGPRDRGVDTGSNPAKILAGHVGRQRHHPLTIDPVVFADNGPVLDARHVSQERVQRLRSGYRHHSQILERRHPRLRNFHLDLKRNAGTRIGPASVRRSDAAVFLPFGRLCCPSSGQLSSCRGF